MTDEKSFGRKKSVGKKKNRNKSRPSTSLFNKKRRSSGNALLTGTKGVKNLRSESAMGTHKSSHKNNLYRPASAFTSHYTKVKSKGKKHSKTNQNKINVKTRNTSFEMMISELGKLKKSGK